ncbi:ATP-grasp domain-containing protein [Roseburia sp. 1XD42-34]|nr:RimK family alpha-L-glutamate ligase [Roseburia sp. 1XD42-34]NBJ68669.1 RimK family alpha-L-glutamate ligase [Roseburia sp. 1XD42-34]RKI80796.1 RimK family alpha-L-glutamate ligase [Clostridium sp. 1xD42-85]
MHANGWIIYNDSLPGNKFIDFAQWLANAAIRKGNQVKILSNSELLSFLSYEELTLFTKEQPLSLPNYVVFTDKDIYLARQLELLGIRVFNSSEAIRISDDKIATYQKLAMAKIPIPDTIIYPKTFAPQQVKHRILNEAIDKLGFPMIVKEAFGSFGEQVYLVHNEHDLIKNINKVGTKAFVLQAFIASSYGVDLRLHVVGNKVVAAMKRHSANDFRANITAGGTMEAYQPSAVEQHLATAATRSIGADFAGVDLLIGANQSPIVCEINSNAHIRNMYDATGINVADFIIDYILREMEGITNV